MTKMMKLSNIVKLFLLILSVWIIATALPSLANDVHIGQDDPALTPVAHLEDRLLELETNRRALNSEINNLESNSNTFELATYELATIDEEIQTINDQMNQAWLEHNQDDYDDDDSEEDDFDSGNHEVYEPFEPIYESPPARMSDTEIASIALTPLNEDYIPIRNHTELRAFLMGGLGPNDGHFRLMNNITITSGTGNGGLLGGYGIGSANPLGSEGTQFLTTGRPGVFTGIFEGGGHTITGLRLRESRNISLNASQNTQAAPLRPGLTAFPGAAGQEAVGFVQEAGDGAVIRNVNFVNTGTADNSRVAQFTAPLNIVTTSARNVGTVIGRTTGANAVVTIDNVNLTGNRFQMQQGSGTITGSWGGMVGRVGEDTTLNMRDVSANNIEIIINGGWNNLGTIAAAGGLVGSVNGGTLNITTNTNPTNNLNVEIYDDLGWNTAMSEAQSSYGVHRGGGVVGFVFSGHTTIHDTTVVSTRGANGGRNQIRILGNGGGIVGGGSVASTINLNNVENRAMVQIQRRGGDGNPGTPNGRGGGLVGHSTGTLHITNSRNYGTIIHQANNATIGGLVGYTGTSSITVIRNSYNAAISTLRHENRGYGLFGGVSTGTNSTRAVMGGIIGRTRGRITIEGTTNYGHINKTHLANNAGNIANTRIGGIIGRATPVGSQQFHLTNVTNRGQVSIATRVGLAGGQIGEIMNSPRGTANIRLYHVSNYGQVSGGREMGGIIARSRPRDVSIRNAENHGNLVAVGTLTTDILNWFILAPDSAGGIVGDLGGVNVTIDTARNYGYITSRTAAGAAITNDATAGAVYSGGIIGRSRGRGLTINDVHNYANVRAHHGAAGIVARTSASDLTVNFAMNYGNIYASRNSSRATAGGIIAHSLGANLLIRNTGNMVDSTIRLRGSNSNMDGVGGILGRTHRANTRIEISFNQGLVTGRNSAGGIIGRNQSSLAITDVYNIGTVNNGAASGGNIRAGNGILGRRRSGSVRITRAYVSARVGGYSVATTQSGSGAQASDGSVAGITFSGVFVDETTFQTTGTGFNTNAPATQRNRSGIHLVDTELLTSGLLPGFSSGPWRYGIAGIPLEDQRTYPYFNWQIPGGNALEQPFFTHIRSLQELQNIDPLTDEIDEEYEEYEEYEAYEYTNEPNSEDENAYESTDTEDYYLPEADEDEASEVDEEIAPIFDEDTDIELENDGEDLVQPLEENQLDLDELANDVEVGEDLELDSLAEQEADELEIPEQDELELEEADIDYNNYDDIEDEAYEEEQYISPLADDEEEENPGFRRFPVMDLNLPSPAASQSIDFEFHSPLSQAGTRIFNTYFNNPNNLVTPGAGNPNTFFFAPMPAGLSAHSINMTRSGPTSIGLISSNGVVGFEAREVVGRVVVRGFDPLFEGNPRYYINHTRFEIVSSDASQVDLNGMFRDCAIDAYPNCPPEHQYDSMRGIGIIRFAVSEDDPREIIQDPYPGLRPRPGGYSDHQASSAADVAASLADYTVVRITALGYYDEYRIIYTGDLNELFVGEISVPMRRRPFAIRVWIPQADSGIAIETEDELLPGSPGMAAAANTPLGARTGFGVRSGHEPGSYLAHHPVLTHTRSGAQLAVYSYDAGDTDESSPPSSGARGHFAVQQVKWGDTLEATARMHTTNSFSLLRFEYLINRGASPAGTDENMLVLDLDLYVVNLSLPMMYFRFVEFMGYNDEGDAIFRNLNIDGVDIASGANQGPMPLIDLAIDNSPYETVIPERRATAPLAVHQPLSADPIAWHEQNDNATANHQHFRVEGIYEYTGFDVVDEREIFRTLSAEVVSDYLEWFYPLYITLDEDADDESDVRLHFGNQTPTLGNNQANREELYERSFEGDPILIRTIVIPLVRIRNEEVRIVERNDDGTYTIIEQATLVHNGNTISNNVGRPGTFTIDVENFNELNADATGFISKTAFIAGESVEFAVDDQGNQYIRIVLEPRFVEVTFDLTGGADEEDFPPQTIRHGQTATNPHPTEPNREDYYFGGWFTSPDEEGVEFDFDTPITGDMTLYARWIPRSHLVDFDLQGGVDNPAFADQTISDGETATKPTVIPEREGYRFVGWYTAPDDEEGEVFDFDAPITEDTTIYARWIPVVSFSFTKTNEYLYIDMEDDNFYHLGGARFELSRYVDGEWEYIETADSAIGANLGLVVFENLLTIDGVYRLDETRPPDGFRPPHGYWVITWDAEAGRLNIEAHGTIALVPAFREVEREEEVSLYLGNFRETLLPASGGFGTMSMALIGILLLSIVALLYIRKRINEMEELAEAMD